MRIGLTFKTPDALDSAVEDIVGKDEDETFELQDKARRALSKFIRYGEYVSIEVDIETGEATVMRA